MMHKHVPWPYIMIYAIGVIALAFSPIDFVYKMAGIAVLFVLFLLATRGR